MNRECDPSISHSRFAFRSIFGGVFAAWVLAACAGCFNLDGLIGTVLESPAVDRLLDQMNPTVAPPLKLTVTDWWCTGDVVESEMAYDSDSTPFWFSSANRKLVFNDQTWEVVLEGDGVTVSGINSGYIGTLEVSYESNVPKLFLMRDNSLIDLRVEYVPDIGSVGLSHDYSFKMQGLPDDPEGTCGDQ